MCKSPINGEMEARLPEEDDLDDVMAMSIGACKWQVEGVNPTDRPSAADQDAQVREADASELTDAHTAHSSCEGQVKQEPPSA